MDFTHLIKRNGTKNVEKIRKMHLLSETFKSIQASSFFYRNYANPSYFFRIHYLM